MEPEDEVTYLLMLMAMPLNYIKLHDTVGYGNMSMD